MTAPEGHLDVLDTRNPWPADGQPHIGMATLRTLDGLHPSFIIDETIRAIEQAARREERFVEPLPPQPRWVPERAHEATAEDMGLPAGWWRDTPPREGMPQPGDTDTFLAAYSRAGADEQEAAERRPVRRARRFVMRLVRGT